MKIIESVEKFFNLNIHIRIARFLKSIRALNIIFAASV